MRQKEVCYLDIQREIPFNIFEEVDPFDGVLETIEDCFYESDLGNMSLHLLTTEDESEYFIQRYDVDGVDWFKCTDIKSLKKIIS